MLMELAFSSLIEGDLDAAKPLYAEARQTAQRIDDRILQSYLLVAFGYFAAGSQQATLAAGYSEPRSWSASGREQTSCCPWRPSSRKPRNLRSRCWATQNSRPENNAGKHLDREVAPRPALGEPSKPRP